MTDRALRLKDELLRLSEEDRMELMNAIRESLPNEMDDAIDEPMDSAVDDDASWASDLDRRFQEIEFGRAVGDSARKVIEELREKYK